MKKLTPVEQAQRAQRAISSWRHDIQRQKALRARMLASKARALQTARAPRIRITPPAVFSFSRNYTATVTCLQSFKRALFAATPDGKQPQIFLDLSTIKEITLAGALVLAAEIHRWRVQRGPGLRAQNVYDWNPKVRRLLAGLGFFKLLKVDIPRRLQVEILSDEVTVLQMISSTELDQELLQKTMQKLSAVAEILQQDPSVYGALVEAAYNAKLHAYPEDFEYEFQPIIKGWWATASFNSEEEVVKFLVYDQGVGIPNTLPKWSGWEKLRATIAETLGDLATGLKDASNLIEAAIEMDRTSLQGGHGKGLQDVIRAVETTPGSSVRILSGTGSVLYHQGGRIEKKDETLHIGGTLIEWRIPVGNHEKRSKQ
ncbi:hypothetical protein [Shinella sp. DD12]|uniref:hypothetical protein n=1 Tax=Shinella sp. DD12 TaxID=1410620 RepID=UPI000437C5D6|nr:hypothetical protein [Shinella sp. DD12]EYR84262.1 hypothetical protein SHLA_14c000440 [Shinella sp. DD12]